MENIENKIETRQFRIENLEVRAEGQDINSRTIAGTAIVFNTPSQDLGGFIEEIAPEAVTVEFLDKQDIIFLYNHSDKQVVLARSKYGKGTLSYKIDANGVNFQFEAKNTALGNEILEAVKAGDLDACSFSFRVAEGGESWQNLGNGTYKRTINKFDIIRDFSIVPNPAYTETIVSNRGLEALKAEEQQKLQEVQAEEQRKNQEEIDNFYNNLKNELRGLNIFI